MSDTVNPEVVTVFTAPATGSPRVQWQVSLDGSTWTDIADATQAQLSFVAHATDNGRSFRAFFTNSDSSVTTSAALLNVNAAFRPASRADFDGDGRQDFAVYRNSTGEWFWLTSSSGWSRGTSRTFGSGTVGDMPMMK